MSQRNNPNKSHPEVVDLYEDSPNEHFRLHVEKSGCSMETVDVTDASFITQYIDVDQQRHITFLTPIPSCVKKVSPDLTGDQTVKFMWDWQLDETDITSLPITTDGITAAARKSLEFAYKEKVKAVIGISEVNPKTIFQIQLPERIHVDTAIVKCFKTVKPESHLTQLPTNLLFYDAKQQEHSETTKKSIEISFG